MGIPERATDGVERYVRVESALEPQFVDAGRSLAYRFNRPGSPQVFVSSLESSSAGGDARQITDTGGVVYQIAARPSLDASRDELLYVIDDGGDEQYQLHLLDLGTGESRPLVAAPGLIHNFGSWSADGRLLSFAANRRDVRFFDVWVLNLETGEEFLVVQDDSMNAAGRFSPDGRSLLVARPNLDLPGDNDVYGLPLDENGASAGPLRVLTPHAPDRAAEWRGLYFANDGTLLALSDEGRDFIGLQRIAPGADGDDPSGEREFLRAPEWDIETATVASDGSRVALVVNEDGYSRLEAFALDADLRLAAPLALPQPPRGVISTPRWRPDGGALALTSEGARHLSDVWLAEIGTADAVRVSQADAAGVELAALPEPEIVRYTSFDGREIPAFFYRPSGTNAGQRLPCLVLVHGGPESQSRPALWGRYAAPQYLLSQGIALLVPNVRGSTGYGQAYSHADDVELRMDSVRDLIAATDWLAASGEVDPARIGVMGGSYGGFMVLAAITEAPERWAAAIDLFGIANFETFLEFTGPWRRKHRAREYGSDPDFLRTISPIHKADQIRTPLLVIQGDHDVRVPQEESEQIVDTVRRNEGVVEYVVYPDEGHGIQKLAHRLDMGERIVAFCRVHLLGPSRGAASAAE